MINYRKTKFSIKEQQAYGGICLVLFCKKYAIDSAEVNDYIHHLLHILRADNITLWERKGLELAIVGRGEPIPKEVLNLSPKEVRTDFMNLIEFSSEIGIIDLYGAFTRNPANFLKKCRKILKRHKILIPQLSAKGLNKNQKDLFGEPYSPEAYTQFLQMHQIDPDLGL